MQSFIGRGQCFIRLWRAAFGVLLSATSACLCTYGGGMMVSDRHEHYASAYNRQRPGQPETMEVSIHGCQLPAYPGNVFSVRLVGPVAKTWPVLVGCQDSGLVVTYDSRAEIVNTSGHRPGYENLLRAVASACSTVTPDTCCS